MMSGGHEHKFLEEARSSFAIPHEDEYFENLSSTDLTTVCGDVSLEAFVESRCLARRLEQESKKAKELSVAAATTLHSRVAELEGRLAAEQERNQQLLRAKEDKAKASHAALEALRLDMENLASAKEDLDAQLRDKDARLTEAQNKTSRLNSVLERYRIEHIRCAEVLRSEVLELLGQCNLDAPSTLFPQGIVGAFYEWVSACFDLITMNTKIFSELGATVGVCTLAYSVCSLIHADRPSSEM
jgi:DNA repair exonuclease SbcCD ATPase subunit